MASHQQVVGLTFPEAEVLVSSGCVYGLTEQEAAALTGRRQQNIARSRVEAKNILKGKMFRVGDVKAA